MPAPRNASLFLLLAVTACTGIRPSPAWPQGSGPNGNWTATGPQPPQTFSGTTGDAREIVRLATKQYKLTRRTTNDPGLFIYERPHPKSKRTSILELRMARVVMSNNPYQRFDVKLVLERS